VEVLKHPAVSCAFDCSHDFCLANIGIAVHEGSTQVVVFDELRLLAYKK
jgi:hypothetical protein|tara:strand:- start:1747 stop:1893 length:147 start_codon:yes stop_codon:yes gene_type:complete